MFVVDMEIMKTFACSLMRVCGPTGLLLCAGLNGFAADVVLQKVPLPTVAASSGAKQSHLGPQATFALINYDVQDQNRTRTLYVSSGNDLAAANSIIDDQVATSFGFSAEDRTPTAIIDLGKNRSVRRLSVTYSARPGSMDFYVLQSLPGTVEGEPADARKLDSSALTSLKRASSVVDDGTLGHAVVDFPAVTGRYLMVRWNSASQAEGAFTMAEVAAFGTGGGNLLASNVNFASNPTTTQRTDDVDSKDIGDSKDVADSKDIPEEGPQPPPPGLPQTPMFTFIPQLVPVSE